MILMGDKKKQLIQILGPEEEEKAEASPEGTLHAVADELLSCIHNHDVEGTVSALKTLFLHFDSEPHEEGPHE